MKMLKERYILMQTDRTEKVDRHGTGKLSNTAAEVSSSARNVRNLPFFVH